VPGDGGLITAGEEGAVFAWSKRGTGRRMLVQPSDVICCLAASETGVVAAGGAEGAIRLFDSASGQWLGTLAGHRQEITGLVFYGGGTRLASCSTDGTARIWDVSTRKCRATLRPQQGLIRGLCISADGETLATTGYKLVLWDAVTGQERSVVADPPGFVACAAFSRDGRRLVTGHGNGAVRLRRLADNVAAK
jgi:WD40 repeat protein